MMIALANEEQRLIKKMQAECHHGGEAMTAVAGQFCSDGLFHSICQRCRNEFNPTIERTIPEKEFSLEQYAIQSFEVWDE